MMIKINIFSTSLLLYFPCHGMGTQVFTFTERRGSDPDELSSATLTNAPTAPLPDHFTICSSHKQHQIGTRNTETIYVLYEDSSFAQPWFSIGFWKLTEDYVLMVNIKFGKWYDLGQVTREAFLFWIHVCVEVDTINGTLRASINGANVTAVNNVEGLTPAQKLHLRLGVAHDNRYEGHVQIFGSVANINIYKLQSEEIHLLLTSTSTCKLSNSSFFLSWANAKWNIFGKEVLEEDLDENILCSKSTVLNFRIPLFWNRFEATDECRKYGPSAVISNPLSPSSDINNVTKVDFDLFYGKHEQCALFWTPFTDEYEESSFVDEITNESRSRFGHCENCCSVALIKI